MTPEAPRILTGETVQLTAVLVDAAGGEVEVIRDGRCIAVLGRSEGFGEIALLHEVPRTATVKARSDVLLYALERETFSMALTGHAPTASVAEAIAVDRETG